MKKNAVLLIVVILLFITIPLGLIGCETANERFEKRIFETEYFRCVENEETDTVTILEFTQKGLEQKAVIIPETINGKKVKSIGKPSESFTQKTYSLDCSNKKIYISEMETYSGIYFGKGRATFILEKTNKLFLREPVISNNDIFVFRKDIEDRKNIQETNIAFYLSKEEENPYWVDAYSVENLYLLPPEPKMEGYVFGGWYTDRELKNFWDKKIDVKDLNDCRTYYAKWDKK